MSSKAKREDTVDIPALLKQGDVPAAERLAEIGAGAGPAAKEARRALFALKQRGVEPTSAPPSPRAEPHSNPAPEVLGYLTHVSGTGGQLAFFEEPDPFGGAPLFHFFLINQATGIEEVVTERMPRREIPAMLERLKRGEEGLVVEAPVDYVRSLVRNAADRLRSLGGRLPQGYAESTQRTGHALREFDRALIYELLDTEALATDQGFSRDPEAFFQSVSFRSWFMGSRAVADWEEKYFEAVQSRFAVDQAQRESLGENVIDEATDALLDPETLGTLKRCLEEQASVLFLAGNVDLAKQAVHYALQIDSEVPPRGNSFIRYYVKRSIFVIMAYKAEQEPEREDEVEAEPENRPLIERV